MYISRFLSFVWGKSYACDNKSNYCVYKCLNPK